MGRAWSGAAMSLTLMVAFLTSLSCSNALAGVLVCGAGEELALKAIRTRVGARDRVIGLYS